MVGTQEQPDVLCIKRQSCNQTSSVKHSETLGYKSYLFSAQRGYGKRGHYETGTGSYRVWNGIEKYDNEGRFLVLVSGNLPAISS